MKHTILTTTIAVLLATPLALRAQNSPAARLKKPAVEAMGATPLPETVVTAQAPAYFANEATTGTKMDTPIRDVPQSIEVRTRQLLDDLGGRQRADAAARSVAGVNVSGNGYQGSNVPFLTLRGFPNNGLVLKDGYARRAYTYVLDLANVERIEFLKGPASSLYGMSGTAGFAGSLGGQVNYISKRPTASRLAEAGFSAGAFDFYRGTLDLGGPLNKDGSVQYRLNGAIESSGSFRDYIEGETQFVAPALSIQLSPKDKLTLLTDYTRSTGVPDSWLPLSPQAFKLPVERFYGEPGFDHKETKVFNLLAEYEHQFSEDWKLRLNYSYGWLDSDNDYTSLFIDPSTPDVVQRFLAREHLRARAQDIELRLHGKVETGPIKHQLLFGISTSLIDDDGSDIHFDGTLPSLDLFEKPTYGVGPAGFTERPFSYHSDTTTYALYMEDLITLRPDLKVLLGGRYDWIHQDGYFDFGAPTSDKSNEAAFSPRAGIVYQPWEPTSLYFGYTTSFQPSSGRSRSGASFKPEEGELFEVGVKQEINKSLNINISVYQLTKLNALTTDPVDPNFSIQTGEQRSRGVELDVNGELGENLRLTLAYALSKAEFTKDNTFPVGTELVNVPRQTFNLFGVYTVPAVKGLEVGAGIYYATSTQAQQPNTFRIPEVFQLDAMLAYRVNSHLRFQLNLENLTDRQNYSSDGASLIPNRPFSVVGSVQFKF